MRQVAVADDFKLVVVVVPEDRKQQISQGMLPEVRRDVADPKPPSILMLLHHGWRKGAKWIGVAPTPLSCCRDDLFGTPTVAVPRRVHQVAVRQCIIGSEFNCLSEFFDGCVRLR